MSNLEGLAAFTGAVAWGKRQQNRRRARETQEWNELVSKWNDLVQRHKTLLEEKTPSRNNTMNLWGALERCGPRALAHGRPHSSVMH